MATASPKITVRQTACGAEYRAYDVFVGGELIGYVSGLVSYPSWGLWRTGNRFCGTMESDGMAVAALALLHQAEQPQALSTEEAA